MSDLLGLELHKDVKPPRGCWKSNPVPLEKQSFLLTAANLPFEQYFNHIPFSFLFVSWKHFSVLNTLSYNF